MRMSGETALAVLLGILLVVSVAQTVMLLDVKERAETGSITLKATGGLAERKSASSYQAPPVSDSGAVVAGPGC